MGEGNPISGLELVWFRLKYQFLGIFLRQKAYYKARKQVMTRSTPKIAWVVVVVIIYAMCHGVITLSPTRRSDRVCSAIVYKSKIFSSLIRYGTFVLTMTFFPTQSCDALVTYGSLRTPPVGALGETSESSLSWLWYHLSRGFYHLFKRPVWWGVQRLRL